MGNLRDLLIIAKRNPFKVGFSAWGCTAGDLFIVTRKQEVSWWEPVILLVIMFAKTKSWIGIVKFTAWIIFFCLFYENINE